MAMGPKYEWDPPKRQTNQAKHRVDFTAMEAFEWETAVIEPDDYPAEARWNAIGFIGLVLHFVVYTERGERIRIFSRQTARR